MDTEGLTVQAMRGSDGRYWLARGRTRLINPDGSLVTFSRAELEERDRRPEVKGAINAIAGQGLKDVTPRHARGATR